jgi:hypothetical protein
MFGWERQLIGVAAFVAVLLAFRWSSILLPTPDPWARAPEAVKWAAYHWAVIPLALLAVGAALAIAGPDTTGRWLNRRAAGIVVFAASVIVVRLNPGLVETTFNPNGGGFAWKTSYHWAFTALIGAGIAGAAIAVIPPGSAPSFTRQALGLMVFAGAFFVLQEVPGIILRQFRVVDGTPEENVSYHWGIIPITLLAVAGATLAVLPKRKAESLSQAATTSAVMRGATLVLAAYPLALVHWFYLYVLRQRLLLGYWPQPNRPDPKAAGMDFHHVSIAWGYDLVPILALAGIGCIVALRSSDPNYRWRWPQALWMASLCIFIGLMMFDPGHFISWWLD